MLRPKTVSPSIRTRQGSPSSTASTATPTPPDPLQTFFRDMDAGVDYQMAKKRFLQSSGTSGVSPAPPAPPPPFPPVTLAGRGAELARLRNIPPGTVTASGVSPPNQLFPTDQAPQPSRPTGLRQPPSMPSTPGVGQVPLNVAPADGRGAPLIYRPNPTDQAPQPSRPTGLRQPPSMPSTPGVGQVPLNVAPADGRGAPLIYRPNPTDQAPQPPPLTSLRQPPSMTSTAAWNEDVQAKVSTALREALRGSGMSDFDPNLVVQTIARQFSVDPARVQSIMDQMKMAMR